MSITVPPSIREAMINSEATFIREIPQWDPAESIDALIEGQTGAFGLLEPWLTTHRRILEVGSGNGLGLCDLLSRGLDVTGVEPGSGVSFEGRFDRAVAILQANGFDPSRHLVAGSGEALPFPDQSFDLVFSIAVLEHVQDVSAVLQEAIRVTRPGGKVIMGVPNYWSWYEWHYDMFWCPFFVWSKPMAKWYVRVVRGRPDYYIDELNFTTPFRTRYMLAKSTARTTIYPSLMGPLSKISALSFALSEPTTTRHSIVTFLRTHRWLGTPVRILTQTLSALAALAGLSAAFNLLAERPVGRHAAGSAHERLGAD